MREIEMYQQVLDKEASTSQCDKILGYIEGDLKKMAIEKKHLEFLRDQCQARKIEIKYSRTNLMSLLKELNKKALSGDFLMQEDPADYFNLMNKNSQTVIFTLATTKEAVDSVIGMIGLIEEKEND